MVNSGQGHLQTSLGSQNVSPGTFVGLGVTSHDPYDKLVSLRTGTHIPYGKFRTGTFTDILRVTECITGDICRPDPQTG